jgi:hypothetical protein
MSMGKRVDFGSGVVSLEEKRVKARQLISGAAYGPKTLKILFEAFDQAWARLSASVGSDPNSIEAARIRLAEVLLSFASDDSEDAQKLADLAVAVLERGAGRTAGQAK